MADVILPSLRFGELPGVARYDGVVVGAVVHLGPGIHLAWAGFLRTLGVAENPKASHPGNWLILAWRR